MASFTSGYGHRRFSNFQAFSTFQNLLGIGIVKNLGSFFILDVVSVANF